MLDMHFQNIPRVRHMLRALPCFAVFRNNLSIVTDSGEITHMKSNQMETFSALLAFYVGNFPIQRPVTRSFNVLFDLIWDAIALITSL